MAIIEAVTRRRWTTTALPVRRKQPLFRPSSPEVIEAPAKHIHIVSEPVPSPEEQTPEEQTPEEAQPDRDPEENEHK